MRSTDRGALPLAQAVALGLIQGPAELLPISSSSHTALIPWLLRWRCAELDPRRRRAFEVALHAGAAAALVLDAGSRPFARGRRLPSARRARVLVLATLPPALAGYALEEVIDRRLSGPRAMAIGLLAGGAAMAVGEALAAGGKRPAREPSAVDGLLVGLAQALALVPGVSRNGAVLAVARARGLDRAEAGRLSWEAGIPVIAGAGLLKARGAAGGELGGMRAPLAAGATAAFASTAIGVRRMRRAPGRAPLAAYAAYRTLLALAVMRSAHARSRGGRPAIGRWQGIRTAAARGRRDGARARGGRGGRRAAGRARRRSP
jgi:undecaprenyl-diphosphatase